MTGAPGCEEAAKWIAGRFHAIGLEPGGEFGTYFQHFDAVSGRRVEATTAAKVGERDLSLDKEFAVVNGAGTASGSGEPLLPRLRPRVGAGRSPRLQGPRREGQGRRRPDGRTGTRARHRRLHRHQARRRGGEGAAQGPRGVQRTGGGADPDQPSDGRREERRRLSRMERGDRRRPDVSRDPRHRGDRARAAERRRPRPRRGASRSSTRARRSRRSSASESATLKIDTAPVHRPTTNVVGILRGDGTPRRRAPDRRRPLRPPRLGQRREPRPRRPRDPQRRRRQRVGDGGGARDREVGGDAARPAGADGRLHLLLGRGARAARLEVLLALAGPAARPVRRDAEPRHGRPQQGGLLRGRRDRQRRRRSRGSPTRRTRRATSA